MTLDERVTALEAEMSALSEMMQLERRVDESRFSAVFADLDDVKRGLNRVEQKIDALPRVLAEMLDERERRKS